ncbi:MAG: ATP-binding cassette domain-containing protein [Bacteroidaceae bacterium]|nr:ATP-binding cassette domain-containing protein [Bacteroidaceae bacterium]
MNDIVLSSLTNLFALFGSSNDVDSEKTQKIIANYLMRHFGIRSPKSYLNLYNDLRGFYDETPDLDKEIVVAGICQKLQAHITQLEQLLMLLRLMEFCKMASEHADVLQDSLFRTVAGNFNISDELFDACVDYAGCQPGSCETGKADEYGVMLHEYGPDNSPVLKTLWLKQFNRLLFTYMGTGEVLMEDVPVLAGAFQVWQKCGVLKCSRCKPAYYSSIMSAYGEGDGKDSVEMCGRDLNFRFANNPSFGLHNFSFSLKSGQLVAIMGGSGTGKSTLLNILNGSIIPQEGKITINGHEIHEPSAKSLIGFVPQDDLLIEELTVYQNLWFTAKLCFNGMSDQELDAKVMATLVDLGLDQAKDLKVGSPMNKYISGGQRKRLNIALELIRQPAVLFLDEPTSGLSSTDTEKVMNLLKEQTYKGKLIVVNIHQPSSDVYKLFDRLWLLDKGGYPVFDGNPIEAVSYFKNAAHYADADVTTCPACGNVNPEIVLNIIDEKSLDDSGNQTEKRKVQPDEWHKLYLESRSEFTAPAVNEIPRNQQKRPGALRQMLIFLQRNLKAKLTDVQYLLITLLEAPLLALICAVLTKYSPAQGYSVMDNRNLVSYFFMAVIVSTFIGMSGSAEEIIKDRAILKREKFLSLSYGSYIWSKILFVAAVALIQTFLFVLVGNSIMKLEGLFFVWWGILFASALLAGLTGLVLSQCMNSIVSIYITIPLLLIPQILLCGLVVDFGDLNPKSKTGNVPLIGNVVPSRWAYEALAVTSFTDNPYEIQIAEYESQKYTAQYYDYAFREEMSAQLETYRDEVQKGEEPDESRLQLIANEMPHLAQVAGVEPYNGPISAESYGESMYLGLNEWFDKVEQALDVMGNNATLRSDRVITGLMSELGGSQAITRFKKDNFNTKLESLVLNEQATDLCKVVDGHIVPQAGFVFVEPRSHNGGAPFYSGVKILGETRIKTLWFNLGVLAVMAILVALALFFDFPGRYMRKEQN